MKKNSKNTTEVFVVGSLTKDVTIFHDGKNKTTIGGTGHNIAFGLGTLDLFPYLVYVLGNDFDKLTEKLISKSGIILKSKMHNKKKMPMFTVRIDKDGKEEWDWQANVAGEIEKVKLEKVISKSELKKMKVAIFSPGTPKSTTKHMLEFSKHKTKAAISIFDPGQMIEQYSKRELAGCIRLCDLLILNKNESKISEKILGKKLPNLLKKKILIITLGADGSDVYEKGKLYHIPAINQKKVISTVGAGDAYRAGLIYGLINGFNLVKACKLGTKFASNSVKYVGCHKSIFKI